MIPRRSESGQPPPGSQEQRRPKPRTPSWPGIGHGISWLRWRQTGRAPGAPLNRHSASRLGPLLRRHANGCAASVTASPTQGSPEILPHLQIPPSTLCETILEHKHIQGHVWSTLPWAPGSTGRPAAGCGAHSHPVGRGAHSRPLPARVEHTPVERRSAEAHVPFFTRSHMPHWQHSHRKQFLEQTWTPRRGRSQP